MGRKNTKTKSSSQQGGGADAFLNMTYKELKKEAVIRGMPFEEVVKGDFPRLQSWIWKNFDNPKDESLLNSFDDWMDENLKTNGSEELIHPQLRLGYVGEKDNDEGFKIIKEKVKREPRIKREKTELGVYKGTKKALVFECAEKGYSLQKTLRKVNRVFPDSVEKSIKIWYKKYLRDAKKTM